MTRSNAIAPAIGSEHHHVFFEDASGKSVAEIMTELRIWLDDNKILLSRFSQSISPSGAIELHLTFDSRGDASLFEQAFCQPSELALATKDKMESGA